MVRPESAAQAVSLLPFLQPSNQAPRLALTQRTTDASYPFAVVDDSAPFSRIIRGSFLTAANSRLKDVFLILQRDQYRFQDTTFDSTTNLEIEACWTSTLTKSASAVGNDTSIALFSNSDDNHVIEAFAPLLFCREKQLFMPLLCPTCGKVLDLCQDDELLLQKELSPYGTSLRRYLFCESCSKSGTSEFFVREREDIDPIFLSDCRDLIDRLRFIVGSEGTSNALPCRSCPEQRNCFGPANSVHNRLMPFSFYPFHLLIVEAPSLNVLDFIAMLSGAVGKDLAELIDSRTSLGRIASLSAIEDSEPLVWTHFARGDERAFPELLFLKLSLLEEVLGRVAAGAVMPPRGENIWVYLPSISKKLPLGWNFRLLFTDDLTPVQSIAAVEINSLKSLALIGLFYFQVLLGNQEVAGSRIVEAVSLYLVDERVAAEGTAGISLLKSLCAPANIFRDPAGFEITLQHEVIWDRVCAVGFDLLDAARGKSSVNFTEVQSYLQDFVAEARRDLFSMKRVESAQVTSVHDDQHAKLTILRVVSDMITRTRAELQDKLPESPGEHSDEILETIFLQARAIPEPPVELTESTESTEECSTVILASGSEHEVSTVELVAAQKTDVSETVFISAQPPLQHKIETKLPQLPEEECDDLSETIMIVPPPGRYRSGGQR